MTVVDNARYEPEQILFLASSSPVAERAFAGTVSVRLLPVRHPRQAPEDDAPVPMEQTTAEIGEDILGKSDAAHRQLRAVGRRRQHVARLQVPRAGRSLPARAR